MLHEKEINFKNMCLILFTFIIKCYYLRRENKRSNHVNKITKTSSTID
jgi:hypothetical protein